MILVDEGGKITKRNDAYFAFGDGSQGGEAYLSPTPVRMIMVFNGVNANSSSVMLSVGQDRVQNVPITAQQNAAAPAAEQPSNSAPAKSSSATSQQKPAAQPHN